MFIGDKPFDLIYEYKQVEAIKEGFVKNVVWLEGRISFDVIKYRGREYRSNIDLKKIAENDRHLRRAYHSNKTVQMLFAEMTLQTLRHVRSKTPPPDNPHSRPAAILKCWSHDDVNSYETCFADIARRNKQPIRVIAVHRDADATFAGHRFRSEAVDVLIVVRKLSVGFHEAKVCLVAAGYSIKNDGTYGQFVGRAQAVGAKSFGAMLSGMYGSHWVKHKYLAYYGIEAHREMLRRGYILEKELGEMGIREDIQLEGSTLVSRLNGGDKPRLEVGKFQKWIVAFRDAVVCSLLPEDFRLNGNAVVTSASAATTCETSRQTTSHPRRPGKYGPRIAASLWHNIHFNPV
ncbi:hypothetical protein HK097_008149 [Rhizophlyctis rosea]|uniref:Uncharacterized protein n=1 Tax=Rhizophlyctis rosea TaxID=64517 RepID=A0AAD5X5G5_9FUNG|nr:hypothetical protein HK097_008149 [Rhizophlyctis rosea]